MAGEIETAAQQATEQLTQMKAAYDASPGQVAARTRAEIEARENDPYFQNKLLSSESAKQDVDVLKSRLRVAEAEAETVAAAAVMSDAQIVDAVLEGKDFSGPSATVNNQIPPADFASAIRDDLELGVPADLVKAFHATGRSRDMDRLAHVNAQYWFDQFNSSPELQQKFAAGDRLTRFRFRAASIFLAGKHPGVTAAEEQAEYMRLAAGQG